MKKLALSTALIVSMGLAQTAQAHPQHSGYLTESADHNISTGFGGCWKIGNWNKDKAEAHCGDKAAPAPVAVKTPAPVVAPAAPAAPEYVMQAAERSHIVYFDFNSSQVNDISEILTTVSGLATLDSITLTGHTDQRGSNSYNDALAAKRVSAVAAALVDAGVASNKISTASRGENAPAVSCSDAGAESCQSKNRRVEVTINGEQRVKSN